MVDYHDFVTESTPKDVRRKLNVGDIWINSTTCKLCGETTRSKNQHDFHFCKCGNVSVDGGSWHYSRSFKDQDTFEDTIIYFDDVKEKYYNR